MKKLFVVFCFLSSGFCFAQQQKTENLIIVTLDGLRWQEVFGGADPAIMVDKRFNRDSATVARMVGGWTH